jgi:hypothetical protein
VAKALSQATRVAVVQLADHRHSDVAIRTSDLEMIVVEAPDVIGSFDN